MAVEDALHRTGPAWMLAYLTSTQIPNHLAPPSVWSWVILDAVLVRLLAAVRKRDSDNGFNSMEVSSLKYAGAGKGN